MIYQRISVLVLLSLCYTAENLSDVKFHLITVASRESNKFQRFRRSVEVNGLAVKVLGMGQKWLGLGQKVAMMKQELEHYKDDPDRIVMYADGFDVLFNAGADEIVKQFKRFNASVLFSAEYHCSPDKSLCPKYPPVTGGKRFLNSGLIIGYAPQFYRVTTQFPFPVDGNDQQYFSMVYVDREIREELNIKLDHLSELFQTFEGGFNQVQITFSGSDAHIYNAVHKTTPLVIHTPGFCIYFFYYLNNYIPKIWKPHGGCAACLEDTIDLTKLAIANYPTVLIGVFIDETVSLGEFFVRLLNLDYPKEKIDLFIHHEKHYLPDIVNKFVKNHGKKYNSVTLAERESNPRQLTPKSLAIEICLLKKCDYYLNLDSVALLDNSQTLRLLIEQNRQVVAPMLFGKGNGERNFRGIPRDLFDRCPDSLKIIKNDDRGLFHVGIVTSCYLIRGDVIRSSGTLSLYPDDHPVEADILFSETMEKIGVDINASNRFHFGTLDDFAPERCYTNPQQFWNEQVD